MSRRAQRRAARFATGPWPAAPVGPATRCGGSCPAWPRPPTTPTPGESCGCETGEILRDSFTGLPFHRNALHGTYDESADGLDDGRSPFGFGWPTDLSGERVLEVGPGTGNFTEHLARTGAELVCVDMSSAIDTLPEELITRSNVDVIQGDITTGILGPARFDRLWVFQVLQHTPSPPATLKELHGLLREGGELAFTSYMTLYNPWYYRLTKRVPDHIAWRAIAWAVPRLLPLKYSLARRPRRITTRLALALLEPVDPRDIYVRTRRGGMRDYIHGALWERTGDHDLLVKYVVVNTFDRITPEYTNSADHETIERWTRDGRLLERRDLGSWGRARPRDQVAHVPEAGGPPTGVTDEADAQAAETEIHHGNQFIKILRHGSWYFAASVLTKLAALVLVPIYTNYLTPTEYGILGTLDAVSRLLPLFISLYLDASFIRFYYVERRIGAERVRTLYSTQFWFVAVWGSGICVLGLLLAPIAIQPLVDTPFLPYMPLVFAAPLFTQLGIMGSQVMRADLHAREVSVINLGSFVAMASVSLTLLIGFGYGVESLLWGLAAGPFLSFLVFTAIAIRRRLLTWTFDWATLAPQPACSRCR